MSGRRPAGGTLLAALLDARRIPVGVLAAELGICRDRLHRYRTGREAWPPRHFPGLAAALDLPVERVAELADPLAPGPI